MAVIVKFTIHQQLTIPNVFKISISTVISNAIMIIQQTMLHHLTTLYLTDLKNNHSMMRYANYDCFFNYYFFGIGLILLFFQVFSGNQCHDLIRHQILHETVFLSQISQMSTMVILYKGPQLFIFCSFLGSKYAC